MKTSATSSIDVPELDTFDLRETVVALLNEELQQERAKRKDAEAKAGRRKTRLRALKQKLEEDSNPNLIDKAQSKKESKDPSVSATPFENEEESHAILADRNGVLESQISHLRTRLSMTESDLKTKEAQWTELSRRCEALEHDLIFARDMLADERRKSAEEGLVRDALEESLKRELDDIMQKDKQNQQTLAASVSHERQLLERLRASEPFDPWDYIESLSLTTASSGRQSRRAMTMRGVALSKMQIQRLKGRFNNPFVLIEDEIIWAMSPLLHTHGIAVQSPTRLLSDEIEAPLGWFSKYIRTLDDGFELFMRDEHDTWIYLGTFECARRGILPPQCYDRLSDLAKNWISAGMFQGERPLPHGVHAAIRSLFSTGVLNAKSTILQRVGYNVQLDEALENQILQTTQPTTAIEEGRKRSANSLDSENDRLPKKIKPERVMEVLIETPFPRSPANSSKQMSGDSSTVRRSSRLQQESEEWCLSSPYNLC